jgi:hypothetical protein
MDWDPANYKHQDVTQAMIQIFYEVYNELGAWFSRVSLPRGHGLGLDGQGCRSETPASTASMVSQYEDR